MRAWRWYAFGDMRLDQIPDPQAKPGWVVVKVKVVQASVSEAQRAIGLPTSGTNTIKRMIKEQAPVRLFGHELCGGIVELGKGVEGLKVGDRVAARGRMPCHECELCRTGRANDCRKGPSLGRDIPGGFAEYTALPAELLAVLPPEITDNEGASIQPASGAVTCVLNAQIGMGDTVAVFGQGCMGSYAMQASRIDGAGKTIAVDVRDEALALSAQLGADEVIDARKVDPVKRILEITSGIGADVVFEAAGGSPEAGLAGDRTLHQALEAVRDRGRVVQIAWHGVPVSIDIDEIRRKGIDYVMPKGTEDEGIQLAIHLVETKRLQLRPLFTHVLTGLEKSPEAFKLTANKPKYKVMNPVQVVVS